MTDVKPKFQHDCDGCKFLGQHIFDNGRVVDLYWCPSSKNDPVSLACDTSVIGRYGDECPDYAASMPPKAFAGSYLEDLKKDDSGRHNWYLTALTLAEQAGLYDPVSQNAIPSNNGKK